MTATSATTIALLSWLALAAGPGELGRTDFPTSGAPEAQADFLRGLLLLHSFEYDDARAAFAAAREKDPGFAMAAWGEAMTEVHPLWDEEDLPGGRAALERLAPTPAERQAKAPTEREKGYLAAVETLFAEAPEQERYDAYARAMGELAARFPDDLDAAAFHALALLGTCRNGRDVATYMRSAAVAEEAFARNPQHPGATHYLIHAYDDPVHAPLGLRPARVYDRIAPGAGHALHMPSHVYLALGMWDEVAAANTSSWKASSARVESGGHPSDHHGYHAHLWLYYARLQQRRLNEAKALVDWLVEVGGPEPSRRVRYHLGWIRAAQWFETGDATGLADVEVDDLSLEPLSAVYLARGAAALAGGRLDEARTVAVALRARRDRELAEGGSPDDPSVGIATASLLEIEGLVAKASGDVDGALRLLAEAAEVETRTPFGFGPPNPVKPAAELLGDVLLELDRPAEAKARFEQALDRAPRRALALAGLAKAEAAIAAQSPK